MTRLLNANFARLFKGKLFWICAAGAAALAFIEIFTHVKSPANNPEYRLIPENYLFNMSGFVLLIITAVFVGIFVGAEHGGVLRNKIIVGHRRISAYFADLLACFSGVVIIHALFIGVELLAGFLCGGVFILEITEILLYELLQLASLLSMCALFTAVSMLIPQKLAGAIASLVLVFGFFFVSNGIPGQLFDIERRIEKGTASANDITKKEVLSVVQDALPFGQNDQIRTDMFRLMSKKEREQAGLNPAAEQNFPAETAVGAACVLALTTAVGVIVFCKMDVK